MQLNWENIRTKTKVLVIETRIIVGIHFLVLMDTDTSYLNVRGVFLRKQAINS